jgi:nucleoside-diphosphate-sugar epimerase
MRVTVTGGLGFIGSHLSERLVADGHDVTIIDDRRTAVVDHVAGATLALTAISDARPVPADVIYHLASPVGPVGVMRHGGRLAWDVVNDARTVLLWAQTYNALLVDVSTSEVYGSGHEDREDDPCTFRSGTSARKEYAVAKLAAETMLRNTPGLDVRIVRPFNVAGPLQKPDAGFVLPRFIDQALAGQPLTVYTPGTQRRAFTHVADIVEGLILAATRGTAGEIYNLGNPANAATIEQLAAEVCDAVGVPRRWEIVDPTTIHGPLFAEAPEKIPDPSKAMRELGWVPTRSRADCIRDALPVAA